MAANAQRRDATMRYIARKDLWDAVARECHLSPRSVRLWKRVPWKQVIAVERAIGRKRHLIRPDLHPII
jgi:hypothetical protein